MLLVITLTEDHWSNCNFFSRTAYSCNDQWQENETFYLITTPQSRSSHGAQRFCFIYREISKDIFLFSSSSLTCRQNFNDHEALVFNATKIGIICYQNFEE